MTHSPNRASPAVFTESPAWPEAHDAMLAFAAAVDELPRANTTFGLVTDEDWRPCAAAANRLMAAARAYADSLKGGAK